jgi:hypothetical protein
MFKIKIIPDRHNAIQNLNNYVLPKPPFFVTIYLYLSSCSAVSIQLLTSLMAVLMSPDCHRAPVARASCIKQIPGKKAQLELGLSGVIARGSASSITEHVELTLGFRFFLAIINLISS